MGLFGLTRPIFKTMSSSNGPTTCLYDCSVMHRRLSPKVHQFRYSIFLFSLDLDEIAATAAKVRCFSHNRWNLYSFRDRDHLTLPGLEQASVKENILTWIRSQSEPPKLPDDPDQIRIHLITLPRVLGYIFNPVSFYFVADRITESPLCAVVQVGNTFREMKPYLLRTPTGAQSDPPAQVQGLAPQDSGPSKSTPVQSPSPAFRLITPKLFYVSPYSQLDLHFDFNLHIPNEHLNIHIDDRTGPEGPQVLLSALTGKRRPLATAGLLWLTLKFPLVTLKVIFLIHWEALRLWVKKLPLYRKSAHPELQQKVFNPHPKEPSAK